MNLRPVSSAALNYCSRDRCCDRVGAMPVAATDSDHGRDGLDDDCCPLCGASRLLGDRYRLLRPLRPLDGSAVVDVFEALDETVYPPQTVIVKILRSRSPMQIRRFQQEFRTLAWLDVPHIPRVQADGCFCWAPRPGDRPVWALVMAKLPGQTLAECLRDRGPFSEMALLDLADSLGPLLQSIHGAGIVHGDIKPDNILLDPSGRVSLIDFGTASKIGHTNGDRAGSWGYGPAIQLRGGSMVPGNDWFALGRTFAHLLTGMHPADLFNNGFGQPLAPWKPHVPDLSAPTAAWIDRLMQGSGRPPSCYPSPEAAGDVVTKLSRQRWRSPRPPSAR